MLAMMADAEPEADVGLDHVGVAGVSTTFGTSPSRAKISSQRRRPGEAEHVGDDPGAPRAA